jgi:predicted metal-dependent hydrolase
MGVTYGRISIREQKTRWGSCSSAGNLNYNWRLIFAPEEIVDYIVVHELAHRLEMNHSKAFYYIVESVLPDYRKAQKWLRENGGSL